MYQTQKKYTEQLNQQEVRTADLRTIPYIRANGKDAARRFWTYMDTLVKREEANLILEESTGEDIGDLGTVFIKAMFSPACTIPDSNGRKIAESQFDTNH